MQTICTLFQTDNHMCTNTSYAVKISSVHSVVYFAIFCKLANPCGLVIRPIVSLSRALQTVLKLATPRDSTVAYRWHRKEAKDQPADGPKRIRPSAKFTHATCARLLHTPPGSKQPRPYTIRGTQNKRETEPVAETITKTYTTTTRP